MVEIFILGSSSAYGVGGETGGWGDLVKQHLHSKMYASGGVGEKYEVYNFAKSGATIEFVLLTFPQQVRRYGRDGEVISIVSVGGNNSKAENEPDNFVSTEEEYIEEMSKLLDLLKEDSTKVIAVGNGYVDESKTNPKHNPLTGGKSYFTNTRRQQFNDIFRRLCEERDIAFVDIKVSEDEWKQKYLYEDGLHPNQQGHRLIFEALKPRLEQAITQ